jgi:tagatose 1,6-diphosphate aldolase
MSANLSAGKLRKLKSLADENGRFKMMAIDQRGSVAGMLGMAMGVKPEDVPYEAFTQTKAVITRTLSPLSSALLTDPEYGYPASALDIPGRIGLLLAMEESGYEKAGKDGNERITRLMPAWSPKKAKLAGADGVKLLLTYSPDASEATVRHQNDLVRALGEECAEEEIPLLLEIVVYPVSGISTDTFEFAKAKPELVVRSAVEFSKPEYGVDILKMEFPCNLKFTEEWANGFFDGKTREAAYDRRIIADECRKLDEACGTPWVILSAGVDNDEFLENIRFASEAGASGFLCGRAIWKGALPLYPDLEAMDRHCRTEARVNFLQCNAIVEKARPWFEHRRFAGLAPGDVSHVLPDRSAQ